MKKGSIVELKEEVFSDTEEMFILSNLGYPLLLHDTPYVIATDPVEYTCNSCGKTHLAIELEEFPDLAFNGNNFKELLSPQEVEVKALLGT